MNHLTKFIVLLLPLLSVMKAKAQGHFDPFQSSYTVSPGVSYESGEGEADLKEAAVNIKVPNENEIGDIEVLGVMASSVHIDNETGDDLHCWSLGVNYSYIMKGAHERSLQFTFVPKVNFDLANGSREILQLGGVALRTQKKSGKLKYKYGLYYNRECFGHFFVPLVGIDWRPNDRWKIYGTMPMNLTAAYTFTDKLVTGFNFTGVITSFRLKDNKYLHKATNELFGFANLYLVKDVLLQARVGYVIGRSYKIYNASDKMDLGISALKFGDDRRQLNDDLEDGMLLQVGLIYRVTTDN